MSRGKRHCDADQGKSGPPGKKLQSKETLPVRVTPERAKDQSLQTPASSFTTRGQPWEEHSSEQASGSSRLRQTLKEWEAGGSLPITPFPAGQQVLPLRGSGSASSCLPQSKLESMVRCLATTDFPIGH